MYDLYETIWGHMLNLGINTGDDITYFDFIEICEEINIEPEEVDIEKFSEFYSVNIG